MDKKKKITGFRVLFITLLLAWAFPSLAQDVDEITLKDKYYNDSIGCDSITLYLNILDVNREPYKDVDNLKKHFRLVENKDTISNDRWTMTAITEGNRIPKDYTISVLVDLSIPQSGKKDIYEAVHALVESAHDSCVYLSFFGDEVSNSRMVTKENYKDFYNQFQDSTQNKYFYSALYAKLTEFIHGNTEYDNLVKAQEGYKKTSNIFLRADNSRDKNLLFIFTGGDKTPTFEELNFIKITDYQGSAEVLPKVYAFYYETQNDSGEDKEIARKKEDMKTTLQGVTSPRDSNHNLLQEYQGEYMPSDNIDAVLKKFEDVVRNEMYNYKLTYKVDEDNSYMGPVNYTVLWNGEKKDAKTFSIGTPMKPWPIRQVTSGWTKYLIALLVAFLTILLFIVIMKVIIPGIKSIAFTLKYYKKHKPLENVKVLVCPMCRQEILPDEKVVTKCRHTMHVKCWKANGYKCVEYGQNCKEGIQDHVLWSNLFSRETLRDCFLTIMGVFASLVSWIIYDVSGRGFFKGFATVLVNTFVDAEVQKTGLVTECVSEVSSLLSIGLLLGFFLSFVFRFFDGVKRKNFAWFLEITGLSLLSGVIGMASCVIGSIILCLWVSGTALDWYYSFPAFLLFSVCTTLSFTIRSTIPFKSALWGGLASAIIGFIVLFCSKKTKSSWEWLNMLLNFIIIGGGLGASLITVRMLAEKYFLVVKNGIRNGLRIPIHKWMNVGNKVTIGMTQQCEVQMAWEKSNKVAKEHVQLYVNQSRSQAMLKPLATTTFNMRTELNSSNRPVPLFNGDTFKIGDTIFQYVEN